MPRSDHHRGDGGGWFDGRFAVGPRIGRRRFPGATRIPRPWPADPPSSSPSSPSSINIPASIEPGVAEEHVVEPRLVRPSLEQTDRVRLESDLVDLNVGQDVRVHALRECVSLEPIEDSLGQSVPRVIAPVLVGRCRFLIDAKPDHPELPSRIEIEVVDPCLLEQSRPGIPTAVGLANSLWSFGNTSLRTGKTISLAALTPAGACAFHAGVASSNRLASASILPVCSAWSMCPRAAMSPSFRSPAWMSAPRRPASDSQADFKRATTSRTAADVLADRARFRDRSEPMPVRSAGSSRRCAIGIA